MLEDLQAVVDRLSRRLGREVAIDDLGFHLLAYSSHTGPIDPVRSAVVLTRQAPPEAAAWARSFPILGATGPVRIPGNGQISFLPRVCLPLRAYGRHFGWLWLIDADESVGDQELGLASLAADEAAEILHRSTISKEYVQARERELLRDLLDEDEAVRRLAAGELVEEERFTSNPDLAVLVLRPTSAAAGGAPEAVRAALSGALDEVQSLLPARERLRLVRPDHALLVTRAAQLQHQPELAASLPQRCARAGVPAVVGIGSAATLEHVFRAYGQAQVAARVAEVVPALGPAVAYERLGVYAVLAGLPLDELGRHAVHPAVLTLARDEPELLGTLEVFLDRAGDTRATASLLSLHRSTVYYRLSRVQELTGVDLDDGEVRLGLHLGLKVLRLRPELAG